MLCLLVEGGGWGERERGLFIIFVLAVRILTIRWQFRNTFLRGVASCVRACVRVCMRTCMTTSTQVLRCTREGGGQRTHLELELASTLSRAGLCREHCVWWSKLFFVQLYVGSGSLNLGPQTCSVYCWREGMRQSSL